MREYSNLLKQLNFYIGVRIVLMILLPLLTIEMASAQFDSTRDTAKVYHLNQWWSIGISTVGTVADYFGVQRIISKDRIPEDDLAKLTRSNVPIFDRVALDQNPNHQEDFILWSDIISLGSFGAPALLFFDKKIRKDWVDISLIYYQTQTLSGLMYSWSPLGPQFIERIRPWAYYENFSLEERSTGKKRNSFFSGHTSTTATANFFMAKVYNDYHPELRNRKWISYFLASIPTITVAILRVKSLNHFPSDVIVGGLVGAGVGILIPEIHRKMNLGVMARYDQEFKGLGLSWRL